MYDRVSQRWRFAGIEPRLQFRTAMCERHEDEKKHACEPEPCARETWSFRKSTHHRDPCLSSVDLRSMSVPSPLVPPLRLGVTAVKQRVVVIEVEVVSL